MKHHIASLGVASVLATTFILLGGSTVRGSAGCSNATLHGRYSVRASGEVIGVGPSALVGVFDFDGKGNVVASVVSRTNGINGQSNLQGVYSVNADCFVADTLTATNGSVSTHESVIFDHGNGYFILNTTAGAPNVILGEGRRQVAKHDQESGENK